MTDAKKKHRKSPQQDAIESQDADDSPEKIEWFREGIRKRREEFGWITTGE